jgi:hypothetical protein
MSLGAQAFSQYVASELTFGPSRIDVGWDGRSDSVIALGPACVNTSATHTISVLHVFPEATTKIVYASGLTTEHAAGAGTPFYNNHTSDAQVAQPFSLGATVSELGDVSFSLSPSDSNFTAVLDFSSHRTMQSSYYSWEATQENSAGKRIVFASGKITRIPPNPYGASNVNGSLVSSQTASFCIG